MPERARSFVAAEGGGAVADAALTGVDPDGLAGIACPVTILTGSASDLFYASIAAVLAERIPGASLVGLSGLRHTAPITDPVPVADAVRSALANDAGIPLPASREAD
jgi:pimeloyl-ACP methyl ester carboxylesterase